MKTLLKYFKGLKTECFLGPLFKLLEACFELFVPLVIAGIIDTGIALGNKKYVTEHVMVLGVLAIVGLTCSLTAQYFSAKAATMFATRVRSALFKHIQTLSYTEIDTLGSGSIIVRSAPQYLPLEDIEPSVIEMAGYLSEHKKEIRSEKMDWIYANVSCRAAIKGGNQSTEQELIALAKQVEDEDIRHCPHGRPVCIVLKKHELERMFGRVE